MTNEELVKLIQDGKDVQVNLGILYEQNKNFIYFVAKPYLAYAEEDDLLQEGYLGFQEAVFHFSADSGAKFTTYAQYRIKAHCKRYIETFSTIRKIPTYLHELIYKYKQYMNKVEAGSGKIPDDKTIMKDLKLSKVQLQHIKRTLQESQTVSFSDPIPGSDGVTLGETLADPHEAVEEVLERMFSQHERTVLDEAIKQLEDNEKTVITCKYWDAMSASQISSKLNLSVDKVRQLEDKAFQVLKRNKKIQELMEERYGYDCSLAYSISRKFALDHSTSSTEQLALHRIELEEQQQKLVESVGKFFDDLIADI